MNPNFSDKRLKNERTLVGKGKSILTLDSRNVFDCFANIVKTLDVSRKTITPKDSDLILNGIKNFENHPNI